MGFSRQEYWSGLPLMRETWVQSLDWEDPLEKRIATHSSILAWRIPWTKSLVGYSLWGHKELDRTERLTLSLLDTVLGSGSVLINETDKHLL